MDWVAFSAIAVPVVATAVSGFFAFLSKQSAGKRDAAKESESAKIEQQVQFYAQVISECSELRKSNLELQHQISSLQSEVHKLRDQLEYYEQNHLASEARELVSGLLNRACNRPAWIHDVASNKWYLNDEYCREFSITRPTFWTPVNIFGRYDADDVLEYISNDLKVVEANATVEFVESMPRRVMDPKCDELVRAKFQKTPIVINERPYVFGRLVEWLDEIKVCDKGCV
ncbi:MAG: hypothetical protein CMK32_08145 [Porticoccaceae bacterium]|nr:hypothetical protein [Porticoccaceae bacterium]